LYRIDVKTWSSEARLVLRSRHVGRFFGSNTWFLANHGLHRSYQDKGRVADYTPGTQKKQPISGFNGC
jgi:hypothetical protein